MKRQMEDNCESSREVNLKNKKKIRLEYGEGEEEKKERECEEREFSKLDDENLLYEVLKHADARTLAVASCVSRLWHRTAQDERLWELICTRHWANMNCGTQQLRSVVLALGGFRRLHSLYLVPLSKTASSSSTSVPPLPPLSAAACLSSSAAPLPMVVPQAKGSKRWGKDEVHLSLSLLSIRYYEKMNFANRSK